MSKLIPEFLLKRKNIISQLIFIAVFSIIFLNIYKPFNINSWGVNFNGDKSYYFFTTLIIVGVGSFVLAISRTIMFFLRKKVDYTYLLFTIWNFSEILIMSVIYCLSLKFIIHDVRDFFDIFPNVFLCITLNLIIPYVLSWLYLSLQEKNIHLAQALEMSKYIQEENYLDVMSNKFSIINFEDEKGTLRLSIKFSSLYYIESADNYVNIYYENKGVITRFLIRKSLKSIEDIYADYPLVRCHRSYIVNIENVKIIKKMKDGFIIDFDNTNLPDLPVSKTYVENVVNLFHK